jgi:hypothetical protein
VRTATHGIPRDLKQSHDLLDRTGILYVTVSKKGAPQRRAFSLPDASRSWVSQREAGGKKTGSTHHASSRPIVLEAGLPDSAHAAS